MLALEMAQIGKLLVVSRNLSIFSLEAFPVMDVQSYYN